jgi:DNA-binding transcriptional LysR family regulator
VVILIEEGVDAAVRIGHLAESTLTAIPLGTVRQVVCASPAYVRSHGAPRRPEDLGEHRCVRFSGIAPHAAWSFRARRKTPIHSVLTCNQADAAIDACVAGVGLGSFLSYMVASEVQAGRLKYVLEDFENEPLPVHFIYPSARIPSPTVRAFAELCAQRLRATKLD